MQQRHPKDQGKIYFSYNKIRRWPRAGIAESSLACCVGADGKAQWDWTCLYDLGTFPGATDDQSTRPSRFYRVHDINIANEPNQAAITGHCVDSAEHSYPIAYFGRIGLLAFDALSPD
jgi:hypothetical protein